MLRLCHGCDDLFAKNFSNALYPELTSLVICGMFISGGRLRRFIKRHGDTLKEFIISTGMLTDGSWASIAQGLMKLQRLDQIIFTGLIQKRGEHQPARVRPSAYPTSSYSSVRGSEDVKHFLEVFMDCFSTFSYLNVARFGWSRPHYRQVKLFDLPQRFDTMKSLESATDPRQYHSLI
jgi:hypothetical protein